MIDGRGKARVTDFGVAVVARQNPLTGAEAASGTVAVHGAGTASPVKR